MFKVATKGNSVEVLINDDINDLIKLELEIKVFDKDGKVVERRKVKAKSWLLNFARYLHALLAYTSDSIVDTDGVTKTVSGGHGQFYYSVTKQIHKCEWRFLHINGAEGDTSKGIVVGSGTTPVSPTDYNLESPIPHGTETGQLYYYAVGFVEPYTDESGIHFEAYRVLSNQTADPITVNEIGIIAYHKLYAYDGDGGVLVDQEAHFLIVRDVISLVEIPAGGGMEVRYKFTFAESTKWLVEALYSMFTQTFRTFRDTNGTSQSVCISYTRSYYEYGRRTGPIFASNAMGGDGDSAKGIVVGGSDVAFDPTQYSLQSPITHGMGAGQLDYQAQEDLGLEELADKYRIGFKRLFANGSGGDVTIKEIGLYAHHQAYFADSAGVHIDVTLYYMLFRKVLSTPVTIPYTATFTVKWYLAIPK